MMKRREFLKAVAMTPLVVRVASAQEIQASPGWTAVGDVSGGRAQVVAGGLGPGRLTVEWSTSPKFQRCTRVQGGKAEAAGDYTAQAALEGLPPGDTIYYRARIGAAQVEGRFRTAPSEAGKEVTVLWGGDVVGQGWGIDPARGGMATFATMLAEDPDLFIHCGDTIYADNPLKPQVVLDDGTVWRNQMTTAKSKNAVTLKDFQGCYRYNLLDPAYRRFLARVPVLAQWDDHEVLNNWDPVSDREIELPAWQAFRQYWPIGPTPSHRLYRKISYGPHLDVFLLDLRSYRAPDSENRQETEGEDTVLLGREQVEWFERELGASKATWKLLGGEMPIATFAPQFGNDSWANGEGPPLGREHELARILKSIKGHGVKNVFWVSADVHYAMACEFLPERAAFKDFSPFWEFIAGPLHAGTFSPSRDLDPTFGAVERFCAVPRDLKPNRPPSENLQFYGKVVAGASQAAITLHNRVGKELYRVVLKAE